jgi:hypothetical protein
MTTQFVTNSAGEQVSVIIPISEYHSLLEAAAHEDETAFLLREPNGSILRRRIENIRQGKNLIERELLPDDD